MRAGNSFSQARSEIIERRGRATWLYREWLRLWERNGGDPDAESAMYAKTCIAQVEEQASDDLLWLDRVQHR